MQQVFFVQKKSNQRMDARYRCFLTSKKIKKTIKMKKCQIVHINIEIYDINYAT